jgi:hypothetical protein
MARRFFVRIVQDGVFACHKSGDCVLLTVQSREFQRKLGQESGSQARRQSQRPEVGGRGNERALRSAHSEGFQRRLVDRGRRLEATGIRRKLQAPSSKLQIREPGNLTHSERFQGGLIEGGGRGEIVSFLISGQGCRAESGRVTVDKFFCSFGRHFLGSASAGGGEGRE